MMKNVKIAIISMNSQADKKTNCNWAFEQIKQAADNGAKFIFLPEMFSYLGDYSDLFCAAEKSNGPLNQKLTNLAKEYDAHIFIGSCPELPEDLIKNDDGHNKVYNTSYVIGPEGILAQYRKIHLFNLNSPQASYNEGDGFLSGDTKNSLNLLGFQIGLSICYDLRFACFYQELWNRSPFDILCVPAAFAHETGQAHWHTLLRSRAIEYQCYVVAANQTGLSGRGKRSYGHSLLIDPWGQILVDSKENTGIFYGEIDKTRLAEVRQKLPMNRSSGK